MPKILTDPKNSMLSQVAQLLAQGGYSAVTVRSVAQGCGVGVGTVYNYFPSKEALLAEFLLEDWRACIGAVEAAGREAADAQPVARCIYEQLLQFARRHAAIFRDEAARTSFAGSFSQYHALLRSQLAAPMRPFVDSDFAADFLAEALLTWSMAGKAFPEIWELLRHLVNP